MRYCILIVPAAVVLMACSCGETGPGGKQVCSEDKEIIKVAVVTGGHEFDEETFFGLFEGHRGIEYVHTPQSDHSEIFEETGGWEYDVIVLYNMTQDISVRRQANFVKLLEDGVGLVALHHSVLAFQKWPEYKKIVGGRLYLEDTVEDGIECKKLEYKHDVDFTIRIEDENHPITKGLSDFEVHDETYNNGVVESSSHILLTTDEVSSDRLVGWVSGYDNGKVCFIESGHGTSIFGDENYRRLVARAIRWCAEKI